MRWVKLHKRARCYDDYRRNSCRRIEECRVQSCLLYTSWIDGSRNGERKYSRKNAEQSDYWKNIGISMPGKIIGSPLLCQRIYWKSKKKGTPSITVLQLIPPVWQTERVLSSLCGICNRRTNRSIRWSCRRIKSFSAEDTAIMLWRVRYRSLWNDTNAEFWRKSERKMQHKGSENTINGIKWGGSGGLPLALIHI